MSRRPRIAVTLPARTVAGARREVDLARHAGADLAEIRFDRWPESERARAPKLFPSPLPLIATLRSSVEGGEGPTSRTERRRWLEGIARLPFSLVDAETARDPTPSAPGGGPRWIGSRHFPDRTAVPVVERFFEDAPSGYDFVKAVLPLPVGPFVESLLPRYPSWADGRHLVMTTGPSGPLSRLWAPELGQPLVFASLPDDGRTGGVEPSQLPVDQLRRAWSARRTRDFAVVGHPVGHSLSPRLHTIWIAARHRRAAYVPLDVANRRELEAMVALGRSGRWAGWSVTHPWKAAAAELADDRDDAVRATGVANTLRFEGDRIRAHLTDAPAVARRAAELRAAGVWDGREAMVLGTGGAARAALFALRNTTDLFVAGRDPARVRRVARELGARAASRTDRHPVGLVVHATTVGRGGTGPLSPRLIGWVDRTTTVLDFVYAAVDEQVRRASVSLGGTYEDGRRLLVYQAAEAHRIWWRTRPNDDELARALGAVGCAA